MFRGIICEWNSKGIVEKALTNKITLCIITLRCGNAELYIGRGIVQTVEKYSRG